MKQAGEVYVNTEAGKLTLPTYQDDDQQGKLFIKAEDHYLGVAELQELIETLQHVEKQMEDMHALYRNAWGNTLAFMDLEEDEDL
jgi:hypothetical protein